MESAGRVQQRILCKDSDGQWRESVTGEASTPLGSGFRGKIVYQSQYSGRAVVPIRRSSQAFGAPTRVDSYDGTAIITLEFDGHLVTGTFDARDTAGHTTGSLSGVREGAECRLFDQLRASWIGTCDAAHFTGTSKSATGAPIQWESRFRAVPRRAPLRRRAKRVGLKRKPRGSPLWRRLGPRW